VIIINDLKPLQTRSRPIVLAAGFFDGVHLGHRRVLDQARADARRLGGEAWVMTFDTHPLKIIRPAAAPLLLTATAHKLALIRQAGMDGCILLPFTKELAAMPADAFSQWLFHSAPTLSEVIVGGNWRFGANAAGTPQRLAQLGAGVPIRVITMPPVLHGSAAISSTRIRQAVTCGDLAEAAAMLGRPFSVLGTVVHGRAIGRTMGYPSANIDPHNEALPPLGVYAVQACVGGRFHDGALNFGTRPTFDKDNAVPPLLELHLLDFSGSLYDQEIEAFFIERLRDEWYFATIEELKTQIADDVARTRQILAQKGISPEQKETLRRDRDDAGL
jgi:riboflavin kinase/FMN adenylyltransferase